MHQPIIDTTRTFTTEFPDYPAEDMPALPDGWVDTSWHNDACPSFTKGRVKMHIDYLSRIMRDTPGFPRFTVILLDEDQMHYPEQDFFLVSESLNYALDYAAFMEKLGEPITTADAARGYLRALVKAGLHYHPDEKANDCLALHPATGEWGDIFALMDQRMAECHQHLECASAALIEVSWKTTQKTEAANA